MSDYRPAKGDRVRVVLEGEVTNLYPTDGSFEVGRGAYANSIGPNEDHVVSVEKIKPALQVGWHRVKRPRHLDVHSMHWDGSAWYYGETGSDPSGYDWTSVGYLGTGAKA